MRKDHTPQTLNSLYVPLIIAIPANIVLLIMMQVSNISYRSLVAYGVLVVFLLITGGISITKNNRKKQILGWVYLLSGIMFAILAFL